MKEKSNKTTDDTENKKSSSLPFSFLRKYGNALFVLEVVSSRVAM